MSSVFFFAAPTPRNNCTIPPASPNAAPATSTQGLVPSFRSTQYPTPAGNAIIKDYMLRDYPQPKDFASFLYASQVLQAEGIKIGAEHLRRNRPRTMGSIYWQLNDCWPVASWSSLDYFGRWKALHYFARRFYAPILVSPHQEEGNFAVYIVSDKTSPIVATLREEKPHVLDGFTRWEAARQVRGMATLSVRLIEVDDRRARAEFADAIVGATFDAGKAGAAGERRVQSAAKLRDALPRTLAAIHALLSPEQREQFAYLVRTGVVAF